MSAVVSNTVVAASVFLLTYLLHSSLAVFLIGTFISPLRRWAHPELRVLIWKVALLLPIGTAVGVAFPGLPHFGLQVVLPGIAQADLEKDETSASMSDGVARSEVIPSAAEFSSDESAFEFASAPLVTALEPTDSRAAFEADAEPSQPHFAGYLFLFWAAALDWEQSVYCFKSGRCNGFAAAQ